MAKILEDPGKYWSMLDRMQEETCLSLDLISPESVIVSISLRSKSKIEVTKVILHLLLILLNCLNFPQTQQTQNLGLNSVFSLQLS